MPPKQQKQKSSTPKASPAGAVRVYLLAYNLVSAALWLSVLGKTVTIAGSEGVTSGKVYRELEQYSRLVQTGACLEVLHSLTGIVRAPFLTTLIQVFSRILLTWGIARPFPSTTAHSPAYTTMLLAWSITEIIRYSFFVFTLAGTGVPSFLTWLRYNTFLILYPLGVGSECWLMWSALPLARKRDERFEWGLWAVLAGYVPGFWMLFTHMLGQRGRVMPAARR
ncbi:PTPLA-domain-containing protein [Polyplosphaeria fusca]|uniref:Very-long-chain (3R)-3-hydroxyacyl-CoA dehydratase n=1 Tax=Polyplosphaeria fusca TaxID=682080 RepID=A0A9P4V1V8_9PLEO|nr:PTPLA-domain-containing protein [Polyplosphaeria fusca]